MIAIIVVSILVSIIVALLIAFVVRLTVHGFNMDKAASTASTDRQCMKGVIGTIELKQRALDEALEKKKADDLEKIVTKSLDVQGDLKMKSFSVGDKYSLSVGNVDGTAADSEWLRVFDRSNADFYGGLAALSAWIKEDALVSSIKPSNGSNVTIAAGRVALCGADGKLCSQLPHSDKNSYIRPGVAGSNVFFQDAHTVGLTSKNNQLCAAGGQCSHLPHTDGNAYVRPATSAGSIFLSHAAAIQLNSKQNAVCGEEICSHLPASNQNAYIRPGKPGSDIVLEFAKTIRHQSKSTELCGDNACSFVPHVDQNTYIRPGTQGKDVYVGDVGTGAVFLGGPAVRSVAVGSSNLTIGKHIDATQEWDRTSGRALLAGWASEKVVLGNNEGGAEQYAKAAPKNTVVATNPLRVYKQLCIGDTCIDENALKQLAVTR